MRNLRMAIGVLVLAGALAVSGCISTSSPHAKFTKTPKEGYPPLEVTFDASASSSPNGAIVSYEWDFGDDEAGSGVTVEHTYTEKGTYSVTLVVTDSTGATAARTDEVQALSLPPVAKFTVTPYYVTVDEAVWFDASDSYDPDGEIVDYLWDFGDGTSDEGVVVSHEYTSANGTGWRPQIVLTVVDDDGVVSMAKGEVRVVGCDSCGG